MRRSLAVFLRGPGQYISLIKSTGSISSEISNIQTNGSFSISNNRISRTAVILTHTDGEKYTLINTYLNHENSCESEWRSVLDGVKYGIKKKATQVNLENDNLGLINSLLSMTKPAARYVDYYYYIYDLIKDYDHFGIRWIPRRMNNANKIFRL